MTALVEHLRATPLADSQKILALTYMHGSRRRLEERLALLRLPARPYECATIDSFAARVVQRWRSLLGVLGHEVPRAADYAATTAAAAALLEQDAVARWVALTHPVLLVDEAQDLDWPRLAIIRALTRYVELFIAADEFQCLDEALRPNPSCTWLAEAHASTELTDPQRTKVPALLAAARALRIGEAPASDGPFKIAPGHNIALAGTFVANELGWYGARKRVAVITPTAGRFANDVVAWVAERTTKLGNGPFTIQWERSDDRAKADYLNQLNLAPQISAEELHASVAAIGNQRVFADVSSYIDRQRRAKGRVHFSAPEIESVIHQSFANRRRYGVIDGSGFRAMTVHGAKNREFDNVVVLWPAAIGGGDEQRRRLLYNAVTRAKSRCLILVESKTALARPPFTYPR
jgi:hypothetical protein